MGRARCSRFPTRKRKPACRLVFETFLQCRSASKVRRRVQRHDLLLPRRDRFGDLVWKASAGGGRARHSQASGLCGGVHLWPHAARCAARPRRRRPAITRLPQEQWRICIPDVYPAYISWETYLQIQTMLKDNHAEYDRNKTRGIPRPGKALLARPRLLRRMRPQDGGAV